MTVTLEDLKSAALAQGMTIEEGDGRRFQAISKSRYKGNMDGVSSFGAGEMKEAKEAIDRGESVSVIIAD